MNDYFNDTVEMCERIKQHSQAIDEVTKSLNHYNEICDKVFPQHYYKLEPTTFFDRIKQKREKAIIKHELLKLYHYYRKMYKQESDNLLSHLSHDTDTYDIELFKQLRQVYVNVATVLYENFNCRDCDVSSTYEVYVLEERC